MKLRVRELPIEPLEKEIEDLMQIFKCPFCGPRDETEFFYAGEAGNDRPSPAADIDAERWSDYLHTNSNHRGRETEIWKHNSCGEFFRMERDTVTHEVYDCSPLRREKGE